MEYLGDVVLRRGPSRTAGGKNERMPAGNGIGIEAIEHRREREHPLPEGQVRKNGTPVAPIRKIFEAIHIKKSE